MKKIFKDKDGNDIVIEGTPEEISEYENKMKLSFHEVKQKEYEEVKKLLKG